MLHLAAQPLLASGPLPSDVLAGGFLAGHGMEIKTVIAAFIVGIVVGITGMGGGALMTPALIFLGVGHVSSVITADLTASAASRGAGAFVHLRQGSPHLKIAMWLMVGSVPMAFLSPYLMTWLSPPGDLDLMLKLSIGFALLMASSLYALRMYFQLRQAARGAAPVESDPVVHPVVTLLVGMLGGLLVGITSVGAGSVIMIAMLTLYPTLAAVKLVGTDLLQAVPLTVSAAAANILTHGLVWSIVIPLIIGSVPGTMIGARIAPKVPTSLIRRGIVIVLTLSGITLLDQASWNPFGGSGSHPIAIIGIGVALVVLLPVVWGLLRRSLGMAMFGAPRIVEVGGASAAAKGNRARTDAPASDP